MANFTFTPTWTTGHGFAIGTEVNFAGNNDSAESLTDVPFQMGGIWIFGGSINYDTNGQSGGRTTLLLRIAIQGDPAGGDAGGGPGSIDLVNFPLYIDGNTHEKQDIPAFAILLENGALPVDPATGGYHIHMKADIAGNVSNTHLEIAMSGMWKPI